MEEAENLSRSSLPQSENEQVDKLSDLPYSQLQSLAISMNLPGNLKWSTLITLVMARRRGDDRMVEGILSASRAKRDRRRPLYSGVGRRPAAAAAAMAVAATAVEEGANGSGDEIPSKPKRRRTATRGRGRPPSSSSSTSPATQSSNPDTSPPQETQQPPTAPVMPIIVSTYSQPQDLALRYREELHRQQQSQLHKLEEEQRQQREHLQEQHMQQQRHYLQQQQQQMMQHQQLPPQTPHHQIQYPLIPEAHQFQQVQPSNMNYQYLNQLQDQQQQFERAQQAKQEYPQQAHDVHQNLQQSSESVHQVTGVVQHSHRPVYHVPVQQHQPQPVQPASQPQIPDEQLMPPPVPAPAARGRGIRGRRRGVRVTPGPSRDTIPAPQATSDNFLPTAATTSATVGNLASQRGARSDGPLLRKLLLDSSATSAEAVSAQQLQQLHLHQRQWQGGETITDSEAAANRDIHRWAQKYYPTHTTSQNPARQLLPQETGEATEQVVPPVQRRRRTYRSANQARDPSPQQYASQQTQHHQIQVSPQNHQPTAVDHSSFNYVEQPLPHLHPQQASNAQAQMHHQHRQVAGNGIDSDGVANVDPLALSTPAGSYVAESLGLPPTTAVGMDVGVPHGYFPSHDMHQVQNEQITAHPAGSVPALPAAAGGVPAAVAGVANAGWPPSLPQPLPPALHPQQQQQPQQQQLPASNVPLAHPQMHHLPPYSMLPTLSPALLQYAAAGSLYPPLWEHPYALPRASPLALPSSPAAAPAAAAAAHLADLYNPWALPPADLSFPSLQERQYAAAVASAAAAAAAAAAAQPPTQPAALPVPHVIQHQEEETGAEQGFEQRASALPACTVSVSCYQRPICTPGIYSGVTTKHDESPTPSYQGFQHYRPYSQHKPYNPFHHPYNPHAALNEEIPHRETSHAAILSEETNTSVQPQQQQQQQPQQQQQQQFQQQLLAQHRLNTSYQVIYNYLACAEQQVYPRGSSTAGASSSTTGSAGAVGSHGAQTSSGVAAACSPANSGAHGAVISRTSHSHPREPSPPGVTARFAPGDPPPRATSSPAPGREPPTEEEEDEAMDDTHLVASLLAEEEEPAGGECSSAVVVDAGSSSGGLAVAQAVTTATAAMAEEVTAPDNGEAMVRECSSPSSGIGAALLQQRRRRGALLPALPVRPLPCRYAADGCPALPTPLRALRHESECLFQDAECPLADCQWGGLLRELAPHLREEHAAAMARGREATHEVAMRALRAQRKLAFVQEADGRLYVVAMRCHGLLYFATLQSVPEPDDAPCEGDAGREADDDHPPIGWLEACAWRDAAALVTGAARAAAAWRGPVLPVSHAPVALYALRQCLMVDPAVAGLVGVSVVAIRATVMRKEASPAVQGQSPEAGGAEAGERR